LTQSWEKLDEYDDIEQNPEEEIPIGAPDMPETGEGVHYPFYAAGAFAILAGIGLIKKRF